jgi:hypothetical protein
MAEILLKVALNAIIPTPLKVYIAIKKGYKWVRKIGKFASQRVINDNSQHTVDFQKLLQGCDILRPFLIHDLSLGSLRVPLVEQELPTFSEYLDSPPVVLVAHV